MAEDDPLMITIYNQIFKISGFDFAMAADGQQAIENLSSMAVKPDLAVLDVMMPRKDGFEVLKFIKADPTLKNIPVIILTNLSSQEDLKKGLDLGADACLVKSQNSPEEIAAKAKEVYNKYHPDTKKCNKKFPEGNFFVVGSTRISVTDNFLAAARKFPPPDSVEIFSRKFPFRLSNPDENSPRTFLPPIKKCR